MLGSYNRILLSKEFLRRDDLAPGDVVPKPLGAWEAQGIELWTGTRVAALDSPFTSLDETSEGGSWGPDRGRFSAPGR